MRTATTSAGRPGEDRLERLLAGDDGEDVDRGPAADDPAAPTAEGLDAWDEHPDDRPGRGRHRTVGVPLLSVPQSLRSSELTVGARAVRGLLVLMVAVCLVLGGRWLWTEHVAEATPPERVLPAPSDEHVAANQGGGAPGAGPGSGDGAVEGAEEGPGEATDGAGGARGTAQPEGTGVPEDLVVHVTGAVAEPGVVTVPAGSRVVDAVRAVGGVTDEADQAALNLARPLVDGEQVWVGRPGETPPVTPGPLPGAGGPDGGRQAEGQAAPLDLNTATQADLEELPGVGPVTAGHILTWRDEHGRFSAVEELLEVSGIGERTLAQLEPLVTVGG